MSDPRSLTSELMALNETLQPQARVGDRLQITYRLGHIQEVRLHGLWNIVPQEYYGGPSWANATSSLASRVCISMAAPRGLSTM